MELRHLRYFVAVAEAGSLTVAAQQRLHTSQPSLSRQIRDLEQAVGAELLNRSVTGVELTAAGRAFLDHARIVLAQVEAATEAARRAAQPAKRSFAVGFLTGVEIEWLPAVTRVLRAELRTLELSVSSDYSPDLAESLMRGKLDVAVLRVEPQFTQLTFIPIAREPLVVLLPSDHPLAAASVIDPQVLAGVPLISGSKKAGVLRAITAAYFERARIGLRVAHGVDNIGTAISLVASTRGPALMPAYAKNLLPWSVVSRPLQGEAPTIDLAVGYNPGNRSPTLQLLLSKLDELRSFNNL